MLSFFKEIPLVDMTPTDLDEDAADGRLLDVYISKGDKKNFSFHQSRVRTCVECGKDFQVKTHYMKDYKYQEGFKGHKRWFCSWTCLSRNRKGRKNGKQKCE